MNRDNYTSLQKREVFHLEFLRWFGRKVKYECFSLKGGSNMRFFFNSFRYSEDMDLDLANIDVEKAKDAVMNILTAESFNGSLRPFGIEKVIPPNMNKAKQTETTQRFKVHLMTSSGEGLFTKVEFSRRGFKGDAVVEPVSNTISRAYKLPPLLVSHYEINSAIKQKINALADRAVVQARDVFDLFVLSSQYGNAPAKEIKISKAEISKSCARVFEISFEQFRDTVVSYLSPDDQAIYNSQTRWDEIKLRAAGFIEELKQ